MSVQRSIVDVGRKYLEGLGLTRIPNVTPSLDQITISGGACRDSTNSTDLLLDEDLNINIQAARLNGLDVGTVAANTLYAVYLVGDSSKHNPTGAVFTSAFDGPTLPAGYDSSRRIGAVATEATPLIKNFIQYGTAERRPMYYEDQLAILAGATELVFTVLSLAPWVPPFECEAIMKLLVSGGDVTTNAQLRPRFSQSAMGLVDAKEFDSIHVPVGVENNEAKIEYKIDGTPGGGLFASINGYIDTL